MGLNKENKIVAGEWLSFMEERGALAGKVASKLISKRWFHGSEVTPTVSVAIDTLRPQLNIFGAWKEN